MDDTKEHKDMNNYPETREPVVCQHEGEHLVEMFNAGIEWVKQHRATAHKDAPEVLKRLVILLDFGPECTPLIAVAGEDPPSREYMADFLATTWNVVAGDRGPKT